MDFVLSSPKWILNLFSTNQSQRELKFLFKFVYIVFTSFTYKRKISGPRIDPCGTPQERSPGEESSFSILTKNVLFVR